MGIGVDLCGAPGTSFTHERKDERMAPMIDLDVFLPVFNGQQTENFVSVYSMRLRVVLLRLPGPLYTLAVYDQTGDDESLIHQSDRPLLEEVLKENWRVFLSGLKAEG